MEHQHSYGNVVTFVQRGVRVNALVVQSVLTNVLDKTQDNGVRVEEHLTLRYLKPELEQPIMGGADLERATGTAYSVLALAEAPDDPENKLTYALVGLTDDQTTFDNAEAVPVALNPHPELVQHSPIHTPQVPAIRSQAPAGKIPAETSYRETVTNADGSPYAPEPVIPISADPATYPENSIDPAPLPETPDHEWLRKEAEAKQHEQVAS